MKDAREHLEEALNTSNFDLGGYINHGFSIWRKGAVAFIGFMLIVIVISMVLAFIPVFGSLLSSLFVSSCLTLGAYFVAQKIDDDEEFTFENFFDGFQFIAQVIVLNLIIFAIAFLLIIPFALMVGFPFIIAAFSGDPSSMDFGGFSPMAILAILPLIYASLLATFAVPMIGFYGLSSLEALQYSARFCHKHWILLFLFFIIVMVIVCLGFIGMIIGVFVTASFIYPMIYAVFQDLTDWEGYNSDGVSDPEIDTLDYFR
ncbi:MAG: hypothetical protein ACI9FN_000810 [Saprospiraceae bacterium]|jgi:hypothetical protein